MSKLRLEKQTLRNLSTDELEGVHGGTSVFRISLSWADLFNKIGRFAGNNVAKKTSAQPNQLGVPPDAGYGPGKI